jgi:hypothetical protein
VQGEPPAEEEELLPTHAHTSGSSRVEEGPEMRTAAAEAVPVHINGGLPRQDPLPDFTASVMEAGDETATVPVHDGEAITALMNDDSLIELENVHDETASGLAASSSSLGRSTWSYTRAVILRTKRDF